MEEDFDNDNVQIYLVALCEKEQGPSLFCLESPVNKIPYELPSPFLLSLMDLPEAKDTKGTKIFLKFTSQNKIVESCTLEQETDENKKDGNLLVTIDPDKSNVALTAYETNEGHLIWKSVNLYSVTPVADYGINSMKMILGNDEVKYKGISSCNFFPLQIDLLKDFPLEKEILGEGSYGLVRKYIRAGTPYAVKQTIGKPSYTASSEVEAMVKLKGSEYVVQIYCAWGEKKTNGIYHIYIAMEALERSLEDYLAARTEVDLPKSTSIFRELISGVEAMHRAGVIHRDLKPGNILMDRHGHVAITDFGTSWTKPSPDAPVSLFGNKNLGTQFYSDPVMESTCIPHNEKVDRYSSGVIYAEMHLKTISKRRNFIREVDKKYRYRLMNKSYDFLKSSIWKNWAGDIDIIKLTMLIKADPSQILDKLQGSTGSKSDHHSLK